MLELSLAENPPENLGTVFIIFIVPNQHFF